DSLSERRDGDVVGGKGAGVVGLLGAIDLLRVEELEKGRGALGVAGPRHIQQLSRSVQPHRRKRFDRPARLVQISPRGLDIQQSKPFGLRYDGFLLPEA